MAVGGMVATRKRPANSGNNAMRKARNVSPPPSYGRAAAPRGQGRKVQAAVIEFPGTFSRQELEDSVADADAGLRMGRPDLALKIIDLTLQLVHEHPALLYRRAAALMAMERFAEALEAFDRARVLKIDSAEFEGHLLAGRSEGLLRLQRFPEALTDSQRAVELCPDAPDVLLNHARALAFNSNGDAATDAYDSIIERHKTLKFERATIDVIIAERDAMVRLFLESSLS
jgi:tetratricopeptide (TPR) repeat protein